MGAHRSRVCSWARHHATLGLPVMCRSVGHKSRSRYTARMKRRSVRTVFAAGLLWALATTMAVTGNCLSRADPFRLQSDTVQWSVVIARGDECIQGLRGKTMILESVSVIEQPKTGRVVLNGPSFRYSAGPEVGPDSFRLMIVGSSMRMNGTSTVWVEVQVR
jgi:hypothetical protein